MENILYTAKIQPDIFNRPIFGNVGISYDIENKSFLLELKNIWFNHVREWVTAWSEVKDTFTYVVDNIDTFEYTALNTGLIGLPVKKMCETVPSVGH